MADWIRCHSAVAQWIWTGVSYYKLSLHLLGALLTMHHLQIPELVRTLIELIVSTVFLYRYVLGRTNSYILDADES